MASSANVRKPLGGILNTLVSPGKNLKTSTGANAITSATTSSAKAMNNVVSQASNISILAIISYISVVGIIILIFLIFLDRFVTPIFKLRPGAPGFIPLPYGDDGILYWLKTPTLIRDDSTIISNIASGYTLSLDIFIHNPMAFARSPRKLFWRGPRTLLPNIQQTPGQFGLKEFNLLLSLTKDTNDLVIATMLESSKIETVKINNAPIRKGFRITIVMFDKLMEVYLNGRLFQSRPLLQQPLPSFHFLNPPAPEGEGAGAVRNLKIWNRCLSSAEVREINPPIDDFSDFENIQSSCGNVSDVAKTLLNKMGAS